MITTDLGGGVANNCTAINYNQVETCIRTFHSYFKIFILKLNVVKKTKIYTLSGTDSYFK